MVQVRSTWLGLVLVMFAGAAAFAQDSGPGPDPTASGDQAYDVTIIRFINVSTGTFTFSADALPEGETVTKYTDGTFTAVVNSQTSTGNWYALDLENFAIWIATATSDTTRTSAIGYSTPDLIAGRLTTYSTTATARQRFRALCQTSYFFGTPTVTMEEPVTATE